MIKSSFTNFMDGIINKINATEQFYHDIKRNQQNKEE